MKPFQFAPAKVLLVLALCTFAARSTINAGAGAADYRSGALSHDNARLTVRRIADFGTQISLNVYIDGVQVTMLPLNTGYDALVRPGEHVISVSTSPCVYGKTRYTHRHVRMHRGETYAFTAMWLDGDWATLQSPAELALSHQRLTY
jgi:hypothetical protein